MFEEDYFKHYSGKNRSYKKNYLKYSVSPKYLKYILKILNHKLPKTFLDIGAADGSLIKLYEKEFNLCYTQGIEISSYACINKVHENIIQGDALKILSNGDFLLETYDTILFNMSMYLNDKELLNLLSWIRLYMTKNSILLLPFVLTCLGKSYYRKDGLSFPIEHKNISSAPEYARPKGYLVKLLYKAGFKIDFSEFGLIVASIGDFKNFDIDYSKLNIDFNPIVYKNDPELKGNTISVKYGREYYIFTLVKDLYWKEVGNPVTTTHGRVTSLTKIVAAITAGVFGRVRDVRLRPSNNYIYIFGTRQYKKNGYWNAISDDCI